MILYTSTAYKPKHYHGPLFEEQYNPFRDRYHQRYHSFLGSPRFSEFVEPHASANQLHHLLQGLAPVTPAAPPVAAILQAVLPPAGPGQLNHPTPWDDRSKGEREIFHPKLLKNIYKQNKFPLLFVLSTFPLEQFQSPISTATTHVQLYPRYLNST
jgi:hypothetical protein